MDLRKYYVENLTKKTQEEQKAGAAIKNAGASRLLAYSSAAEDRSIAERLLGDFDGGKLQLPDEDKLAAFVAHLQSKKRCFEEAGKKDLKERHIADVLKSMIRANQEVEIAKQMLLDKTVEESEKLT